MRIAIQSAQFRPDLVSLIDDQGQLLREYLCVPYIDRVK
jgi:hypothetical protein